MTVNHPPGDPQSAIRPFRLDVSADQLQDLHGRLDRIRWPGQAPTSGWSQGVPLAYLRELTEYWRSDYDWPERQAELNSFAQFTTILDGARVHFMHVRSPESDALPVIMTHGWPGSVVEFLDVIGPLTDPRAHGGDPDDALHLVLPHIPGYALSGPTPDAGWTISRVAGAWAELMHRLDYPRYGAQGGDWGHAISLQLGALDGEHVLGVHLNTLLTPTPTDPQLAATLDEHDKARLRRLADVAGEMSGYSKIQETRPQTLAYGLTDSPVGQLAWIAEKFHDWADPRSTISPDRLLTNVMLYWLSATAASSARLYYETIHSPAPPNPPRLLNTPVGVAVFTGDLVRPVRRLAQHTHNITHWTEHERGGHFAALEQPGLFASDVQAFFRQCRRSA